jgi:Protein of unknown function (DUF2670)
MWNNLKRLLTVNPMGAFIWGIIGQWYIAILVASVIVLFYTFKGLETAGVFTMATKAFNGAMINVKSVAKYCVPLITDRDAFWKCLQKDYTTYDEENQDAKNLEEQGDMIQKQFINHKKDPHDGPMRGTDDVDPYEGAASPYGQQ